jgi:uncharacterized protein YcbK (DUF882 family)
MPVALRDAREAERSNRAGQDTGCTLVLRKRGLLAGLAAALLGMSAGAPQVVATFGTTRTISMHHIHTDETITITYKKDGKYDPEALKKLNWFLRDWRENQATEMDPRTIDLLWEMHTELGSKVPIDIICGYRSEKTNEMLRRTVGGQAKQSQHITGKAIDAVFPDIPLKQMRYSALIREVGGVGYYPTSGTPFVHVDTGPVRAWPRLPRYELALLFPNGQTKHMPDDGDSISKDDVRAAQARHKDLATEVAAFFEIHNHPKPAVEIADASWPPVVVPAPQLAKPRSVRVASITPVAPAEPIPQLTSPPQQRRAPVTAVPPPTESERGALNALVSLASLKSTGVSYERPPTADRAKLDRLVTASADAMPSLRPSAPVAAPPTSVTAADTSAPNEPVRRVASLEPAQKPASTQPPAPVTAATGFSDGWAPAPEFDDDHPEEVSYRPFPIAPLLTESASADDVALVKLVHPDIARTLDLLDDRPVVLPLRLRAGEQTAEVKGAQTFRGGAVDASALGQGDGARPAPEDLASHSVRATAR